MSANVDLVRAVYAAFAAGDIAAVLSRLASDIAWHEAENFPYADRSPYLGHDEIVEGVFARLGSEWDGFAALPWDYIEGGDAVVVLGRYRGVYKATGRALDAQMAHVWRIEDGSIVSFRQYVDTLHVARVTGAGAAG